MQAKAEARAEKAEARMDKAEARMAAHDARMAESDKRFDRRINAINKIILFGMRTLGQTQQMVKENAAALKRTEALVKEGTAEHKALRRELRAYIANIKKGRRWQGRQRSLNRHSPRSSRTSSSRIN